MLQITPLYAGLLTPILLILSYRVVLSRRIHKVSVGDKGEKEVIKRMRAQSNWVEYAPIGIVLLAIAELSGTFQILLHLCGASLLFGRALHAYGFSVTPQKVILRIWGMYLTLTSLGTLAVICVFNGLT